MKSDEGNQTPDNPVDEAIASLTHAVALGRSKNLDELTPEEREGHVESLRDLESYLESCKRWKLRHDGSWELNPRLCFWEKHQ